MRRLPSVLIALLLVAGLSACGSGDGKTSSTAGSNSARSSAPPAAQTGQALFDDMTKAMAEAGTASVTFQTAIGAQQVGGNGNFRFDRSDFAADMVVTVPGQGKAQVILLPGAFYLKLPAGMGTTAAKPWIKIGGKGSANDPLTKSFGPLMDQVQQSFDPQSNLGVLKATTKVTKRGTETVDGVETTKYTATVDLEKAAVAATGTLAEQYRAMVEQGVKTLDFSIWVDDDQLPRKFSTVVPTRQGDVQQIGEVSGTYSNWGEPVSVKAPPKNRITRMGSMPGLSSLAG